MQPDKLLRERDLRKTAPRVAIINILSRSTSPMSEADIKKKMGAMYDRITFYRTMQTLEEAGIIHRIVADNVTIRYAFNKEEGGETQAAHVHFFCKTCNRVICMEQMEIQDYHLPEGFVQKECEVVIKGICRQCNLSK